MADVTFRAPEIHISVSEQNFESDAGRQIAELLLLAGVDTAGLVFSGHASEDGLLAKELADDEHTFFEPPETADDDAYPIFFANFNYLLCEYEEENPLSYAKEAYQDEGSDPKIDVYANSLIDDVLKDHPELREVNLAWLTEEQVRAVTLGVFVLHIEQ